MFYQNKDVEKFKKFILDEQSKNEKFFKNIQIFEDNEITVFGTEIFDFWLASIELKDLEKTAFLNYANNKRIPVIDHDKNDLSVFGDNLFSIWTNALKYNGD